MNASIPPDFSHTSAAPDFSDAEVEPTKDYVQIILFVLFVIIGLPINVSTFFYMLKRYRHAKSFLLLLHIHLNITDILVLGPSTAGTLIWNVTGQWLAGNYMCKIMRFVDMFNFMASSNIMVCIAIYRLYALRYPLWVSAVGHSRVPRLLVSAWGMAALCSSPQLFLWRQIEIDDKTLCVNYWTAKTHEEGSAVYSDETAQQIIAYNVGQAVVMFYIPCAVLIVCYVLILKDIYATLKYDNDSTSVLYMAEWSRFSACRKSNSPKLKEESVVALQPRYSLRGQDRLQKAKVRSLRITLLLILCYVITWLPYNMLIWLMVYDLNTYIRIESSFYFLYCLVYLNSVINPFIYGRCEGLKLLCICRRDTEKGSCCTGRR